MVDGNEADDNDDDDDDDNTVEVHFSLRLHDRAVFYASFQISRHQQGVILALTKPENYKHLQYWSSN